MLHYYSLNSLLLALRNENNTEREKLTQTPTSELEISFWLGEKMLVRVDGGYCQDQIGSASFACHFSCISKLQIEITDICSEFQIYQKPALAKRKISNFLCNSPPTLWWYRWRKRNWQTTKTFGFCVNWLRNSERLNRLSNMTRQAFVSWRNFYR